MLLQKNIPFKWTPDCEAAFQELKNRLTSAPILIQADTTKPFCIKADSSKVATGVVLLQMYNEVWHPIAYASHTFSQAQINWPIQHKELYALKHALHIWRHYLLGQEFTAYTDHQSLSYLLKQKDLTSPHLARWAEELADFNVTIEYIPGTKNIIADSISRRSSVNTLSTPHTQFLEHLREQYQQDPALSDGDLRKILADCSYDVEANLFYHKSQLYVLIGSTKTPS